MLLPSVRRLILSASSAASFASCFAICFVASPKVLFVVVVYLSESVPSLLDTFLPLGMAAPSTLDDAPSSSEESNLICLSCSPASVFFLSSSPSRTFQCRVCDHIC